MEGMAHRPFDAKVISQIRIVTISSSHIHLLLLAKGRTFQKMLKSYPRAVVDGFSIRRTPDDAHGLLIIGVYTIGTLAITSVLNLWPSWLSLLFATGTFVFLEYVPGARRESVRRNILSISAVLAIGIMVGPGQYTVCQREGVTTYNVLNTSSIDYNSYGTIRCRTYYFWSHESHESMYNITNLTPRITTKLEMTELASALGHKQTIEFFTPHGLSLYRYIFVLEPQIQPDSTGSEGRGIPHLTASDKRLVEVGGG